MSDKNIKSFKKKGEVPNAIAVAVTCFNVLYENNIDFRSLVEELLLKKKPKLGGFAKTRKE